MNRAALLGAVLSLGMSVFLAGCERRVEAREKADAGTGPVPSAVEPDMDAGNFKVDHPEEFPLVTAGEHRAAPEVSATGVIAPDVSRQVPVPSLSSGRVVEIAARLGDEVRKGQLLFKVRSSDVAAAFSDYRKAAQNEQLAKSQLDRAKILFDDGAVPRSAFETAENAESNARVDLETATEKLRLLGADPVRPTGIVEVRAPVTGVITDQQIADSSGVQALTAPNPFTISDTSHVWVVCDVYENDLAQVRVGEYADIHLNAYPTRLLRARIANIGQILDPSIHAAKVRLEVANPGLLRFGMFVTATFHGAAVQQYATLPATAVLHLHDREWVYTPTGNGRFHRVEVVAGTVLPDNIQEIVSGISPGARVVRNALVLQSTVEQ